MTPYKLIIVVSVHTIGILSTNITTQEAMMKVVYDSKNASLILTKLLQNYDSNVRPYDRVKPVIVTVDIDVLNINSISEKSMEFSFHCYFRQKWLDPRLRFQGDNTTLIPLNPQKGLEEFWHPDTYIRNGKHSFLHRLTVPNRLLRLRPSGALMLSQRLTITARCMMDLQKFPMDTQSCPLIIGSLAYSSADVLYKWHNLAMYYGANSRDAQMSQFSLVRLTKAEIDGASMAHRGENVSLLTGEFVLLREMGYFLLQIYTPCSMIVVLSWVSFWINKEAAIARCSLGVTTVLTLTTLRLGVEEEFPPVDYATAIDVFMIVSFFFVYLALFEYIIIHFTTLNKHRNSRFKGGRMDNIREYFAGGEETKWDYHLKEFLKRSYVQQKQRVGSTIGVDFEEQTEVLFQRNNSRLVWLPQWDYSVEVIDYYSKYFFPISYTLFHLAYWSFYLF